MDHEPLARIERDRIGEFDSVKPSTKFRTYESTSGVGGVDVQPQAISFAL